MESAAEAPDESDLALDIVIVSFLLAHFSLFSPPQ